MHHGSSHDASQHDTWLLVLLRRLLSTRSYCRASEVWSVCLSIHIFSYFFVLPSFRFTVSSYGNNYCRTLCCRARSWLYFIEVKATPNGGSSQFCLQTPLNQPDLLELNVLDVVNTPGLIQIGEENSRSSQPRYIATVSSPSPDGYDSEGGFIKVNRQLPYEKLLGLVLTETSQALDGATIFGSHSGWSLDRDHHVVYMPDSDNPGTWYRLLTEASDGAVVLAVPPPGPVGSDNASNRILRLVGGSCNPSIMSMVMPSLPPNYKSSRHYNVHGYFAPGMVVNKRRILIGCNSRSHRCCPDGTVAVLDPSAIPSLSSNDSLNFCARRSAPMRTQYWNTRGNTWFGPAAAYRIAANTIVGFILLILAICHGRLDPSGIDSLLVLSVIRIVGDWCTRAIFLYTSVKNHTIEKSEVLPRFLSLRSVDMLLSGVGWSNSKSTISAGNEEAENEDDAPSFWIRRTFIRLRSVVSSIFVSYSMYVLIQHHGGDLPVATITFVATLLVSQTAASFVNGVSLLGALFDEFTGANINGRQMEIFLATSAIIDLIASTLVSVVLYQDTSESMTALFLLAGVWLDSFLYAITLLRARALLSRGLGQEEKALVAIESESTQLVLSTLEQFESSASSAREWGLCAIANHNEYRGLLALFEDFNFCIHANTLSFSLADWATRTEPNGFRLVPLLHRDGLAYQGQDFDGNLKFLHKKFSTPTDFYYGRIRMLYLDVDTPLLWPTFPVQPVIGGSKKNGKKIDLEHCPSHPATWNQAPRMTALVFGDTDEIIIPLAPGPGAAAKILRRESIPELTDTERSPDNSEV